MARHLNGVMGVDGLCGNILCRCLQPPVARLAIFQFRHVAVHGHQVEHLVFGICETPPELSVAGQAVADGDALQPFVEQFVRGQQHK